MTETLKISSDSQMAQWSMDRSGQTERDQKRLKHNFTLNKGGNIRFYRSFLNVNRGLHFVIILVSKQGLSRRSSRHNTYFGNLSELKLLLNLEGNDAIIWEDDMCLPGKMICVYVPTVLPISGCRFVERVV